MNIGLPGAGIGGLYYLICTAIMPVKELFLVLTRPEHKFRYRLIVTQLGIAGGIIAGLIFVYQLIHSLFGDQLPSEPLGNNSILLYSLLPIMISLGLLMAILSLVELAAFFSKKAKQPMDD